MPVHCATESDGETNFGVPVARRAKSRVVGSRHNRRAPSTTARGANHFASPLDAHLCYRVTQGTTRKTHQPRKRLVKLQN